MTQDRPDDPSRSAAAGAVPVVYPGQAALGAGFAAGAEICRACSTPLVPSSAFCPRCGTPRPGAPVCPHCGSVADVAPEPEVRLVCKTCGAPRVVVDLPGYQSSGAELGSLRAAEAARRSRRWWRIGGAFGGLAGGSVLLLSLLIQLIFGFGLFGTVASLVVALPFLLLAVASIGRSSSRSAEVKQAIAAAWLAAAKDAASRSKQPMSASALGQALRMPEAETEKILAELAVDDMLRSDVTEEGQLAFARTARIEMPDASSPMPAEPAALRVQGPPLPQAEPAAPGARVASPAPAPAAGQGGLDAELEQMAAAELAAREGKARQEQ